MATTEEKIDQIQESLGILKNDIQQIKDKTSSKWVLPVIMLFLTVATGTVSYFLQKEMDIERKVKEKLADLRADRVGNFFTNAETHVEDLANVFEGYLRFGDSYSDSSLNTEMVKYYYFYTHAKDINPQLLKQMEKYSRFVSESKNTLEVTHPSNRSTLAKQFLSESQRIKQAVKTHIKREEKIML